MNIFIGSLPFTIKESDLREVFEEYGAVESAKIITDKFTGRSKGFGFVEMNNDEEAKRAIEELNGAEVEHRIIVVNEARERTENTGSFGGGNNNRRRNNSRGRSY
jgi:RNA recognition motif-containing protein